jgi:hypothetical protein
MHALVSALAVLVVETGIDLSKILRTCGMTAATGWSNSPTGLNGSPR